MRLTLDLDNCSFDGLIVVYQKLRKNYRATQIEIRQSASGLGYHVIVYTQLHSFKILAQLRKRYGDDPRRIRFDALRKKDGVAGQVLFSNKGIAKAKVLKGRLD